MVTVVPRICEDRETKFASFMEAPPFLKEGFSWEDFLGFCKPNNGEPFLLTLARRFSQESEIIQYFYFFGTVAISEGDSFGKQCFVPIYFPEHSSAFFPKLDKEILGLKNEAPHMNKIISISFDANVFQSKILDRMLNGLENVARNTDDFPLALRIVDHLESLRGSLPNYKFPSFDEKMKKVKSILSERVLCGLEKIVRSTEDISSALKMVEQLKSMRNSLSDQKLASFDERVEEVKSILSRRNGSL